MTAVPARQLGDAGQLPAPRRLTAARNVVERRLDELEVEAADLGLLLEQIAREHLADGRVRVDVHFIRPPAVPAVRWWQGRSWRFWIPVASGGVLAFGGCLVAAVIVLTAIVSAAVKVATMALGAVIVIGGIAVAAAVRGGGSFSGKFSGRMD